MDNVRKLKVRWTVQSVPTMKSSEMGALEKWYIPTELSGHHPWLLCVPTVPSFKDIWYSPKLASQMS